MLIVVVLVFSEVFDRIRWQLNRHASNHCLTYEDVILTDKKLPPNHHRLPEARDVRMVLVNPSHPGNIGGAARAMKTMAVKQLVLVNPREYPDPRAVWRAAGDRRPAEATGGAAATEHGAPSMCHAESTRSADSRN